MTTARLSIVLLCASALAGCATAPTQPSLAALPGNGKTPAQFASDDTACRAQANAANNGITPQEAANRSAAGTVAATTLGGAAVGALAGASATPWNNGVHAGYGAAAGAGAGLLLGLLTAGRPANASGAAFQRNYDMVYFHCMAAAGNRVPAMFAAGPPMYPPPPPPPGYYAPPPGYYPGYPPPPAVVVP